MNRLIHCLAGATVLVPALCGTALAQKAGGVLKLYHRDSPASASIHEESSNSTIIPFMAVFNNLVLYDQNIPRHSVETIRPELAESWSWNDDRTKLTFKLRDGVKWHDGKPFTAKDVECTWSMLLETSENKLRRNPRQTWYGNLDKATADSDREVTFHLERPQPSLLAMLASGYSPVYPCHVPARDMRAKPIGTGPFKVAEFKQNEGIKLVRNPDYWKPGQPYLDGIEYTIITNRSTRILGFIAGEFDMTYPSSDVSVPLMKDIQSQLPEAQCELVPTAVNRNLIVNPAAPPFDDPELRRALALALDRKAYIDILSDGRATIGPNMLPGPEGVWGMPEEMLRSIPGYDGNVAANRETARKIMESRGYGPQNRLKVKISTRNIAIYRDPAVLLIDQLRDIYIDGELEVIETANWAAKVSGMRYTIGQNLSASGVDDPDVVFYEHFACESERNYTKFCDRNIEAMVEEQSRELDQEKRRRMVWEIDRKLLESNTKPIIYHERAAACWRPYVKGFRPMVNSAYNGFRFDGIWMDK